MKIQARFEGGADMTRRLQQLPFALSRKVQVDALTAGAEPIRARAQAKAPRDASAAAPHLQDNIVIGVPSARSLEAADRGSETVVEVGPAAGVGGNEFFYGYFSEFGTARESASPFMRPAFDAGVRESLGRIAERLWDGLRKALPTSFSGTRGGAGL